MQILLCYRAGLRASIKGEEARSAVNSAEEMETSEPEKVRMGAWAVGRPVLKSMCNQNGQSR